MMLHVRCGVFFIVLRVPADSGEVLCVWTPHHGDGMVSLFHHKVKQIVADPDS